MNENNNITLAFSGASGVPYGLRLLDCLIKANKKINLIVSEAAREVFRLEAGIELPKTAEELEVWVTQKYSAEQSQVKVYSVKDWMAPMASGSAAADAMVICPCSSSTLGKIAHGISDTLLERSAEVSLKEKKPLIIVHRETPLSVIHLENMLKLAQAGATLLPASPGFYYNPTTVEELVDFVVARVLDHLHIPHQLCKRWGE